MPRVRTRIAKGLSLKRRGAPSAVGLPSDAADLAEIRLRLEGIVAAAMDAIISVDGAQRIILFNPAAERMFGWRADEAIGQDLSRLIPERYRQAHAEHIGAFLSAGMTNREMRSSEAAAAPRAVIGLRANGEEFPMEASISQVEVGGAKFATVMLRDISVRIADEEARDLLAREVDHRAKNVLSVVQALVNLTRATSKDEFVAAVQARVSALARSHSLLAKNRWGGADLRQLLVDETAPYLQPGQVRIDGGTVLLRASAVESVGLVIHELATNAVKYGALSVAQGHVDICVDVLAGNELELRWSESGGPAPRAPDSKGFGFTLIERLVTGQQGGKLEISWPIQGLHLVMILPPTAHRPGDIESGAVIKTLPALRVGEARRVLLVEDEPIVAMELGDQLAALGWDVAGPAATIEEAKQLLDTGPLPDIAILNVNLRGRLVYPIADRLRASGVALVFCTGYEQVDLKYRDCPIIRKPVKFELLDAQLRQLSPPRLTRVTDRRS